MRARLLSLLLTASICLSFAGCGGLAGALGGILIEPMGYEDAEAHILSLKYARAGGSDIEFEVFTLQDGAWTGPAPEFAIPDVNREGSMDVIFNFMPERISARITGGNTDTLNAVSDMGDMEEPESASQGVVYITSQAGLQPGERLPVAMQYYGGDGEPQLSACAEPEALDGYDAVYVLTVKFE